MKNWNEIKAKMDRGHVVYIFGAGAYGNAILEHLHAYPYNILFCDNDKNKQNVLYNGRNVVAVEEACCDSREKVFLVSGHSKYKDQMIRQLIELGVESDSICECYESTIPHKLLRFEIQLSEHCNLKCKGCSHMSPLADKSFVDIKEIESDYNCISNLFGGEVERVLLLGGEPLLYPDLDKACELSRRFFPDAEIAIVTNGLLLGTQKSELWDICKENNIEVSVTEYPINFDYAKWEDKVRSYGVVVKQYALRNHFVYYPMDIDGKQDIYNSFTKCRQGNSCILLSHGRIYPCARPWNSRYLNKYFNCKFQESLEDSIDIYKVGSKEELLKKIAEPVPFCRYCKFDEHARVFDWCRTEFQIEEWCDR